MKKLIIISLILFSLSAYAQDGWKKLGLFTASIALDAAGDAMMDEGKKDIGHVLNAASIGTTLSIPLLTKIEKDRWYGYLLSYAFIRFAIFDYTYNTTRGLPLGYTGNTSHYDRFMQKVPDGFELWSKTIILSVGISINLKR